MVQASNISLKDALARARQDVIEQAGGAMGRLQTVAAELEMKEIGTRIKDARERLESDNFNLIVLGRFKNGKSTLMNALLGKLTHPVPELRAGQGPMPVDDLPTTATLTSIQYAEKPYVRVWNFQGKWEGWSLERYLKESMLRGDEEENEKFFSNIRQFEVGFPAELCKSGVTLMDSPGLDDVPQRTAVTRQAVDRADAAIVVYRSDVLAGEGERRFVTGEVTGSGTRLFTVVNLMHGRAADERFKGFVWNRIIQDAQGGPKYSGQDLSDRDIYFVNALEAQRAKLTTDEDSLRNSGLALLEQRG